MLGQELKEAFAFFNPDVLELEPHEALEASRSAFSLAPSCRPRTSTRCGKGFGRGCRSAVVIC